MKRIFALLIAVLMLMSCFAALADETPTYDTPLTLDGSISLSNLEAGDTVNFYQVLKYDQNATTTGGWVATTAFAYNETSNQNGLKPADIQKILGLDADGKPVTITETNKDNYGISADLAAQLADIAKTASPKYENIEESSKVATVENPEAGLYLALVTPGNADTLYNPIFVGADYNSTDGTNTISVPITASYSPASIAKKSTITLEKTASTSEATYEDGQPETVAVGDTVSFTVVTKIPEYADNYVEAVFKVIDTLSEGLELQTSTIKVYADTTTADETKKLTASAATYTLDTTPDPDENETWDYVVDFATEYILGDGRGKNIVITYDAKVTTEAPFSVNMEKNTVEVNFSNSPTDNTGAGKLKDETKHYTFDIDADILGQDVGSWPTTEVVKVGLDKNGNEIYEKTTTLHAGQTSVGALEGATFKLYYADANGSLSIQDYQNNDLKLTQYTNTMLPADATIVSNETGRLYTKYADKSTVKGIHGLDIGTYYLVEETAPAGYIRYQKAVKIEIIAPKPTAPNTSNDYWELKTYTDDDYLKSWDVWELKKYEVEIDDYETADYTFVNKSNQATNYGDMTPGEILSTKTDTVTGNDDSGLITAEEKDAAKKAAAAAGKIVNTQGVELPHTGGIGTTLFYVGGSILVLAAVILLVTKRRMGGND